MQTAENKRYQIMLNSGGEEIMVYLISNEDDKSDEDQRDDADPEDDGEGEDGQDSFANLGAEKNEGSPYESDKNPSKEVEELESISVLFQ